MTRYPAEMTQNKDGFWFTIAEGFQFLHRAGKAWEQEQPYP